MNVLSQEKRKPIVESPVKYEKIRKILEFVPNKIKDGESIVVRTKKYWGFSEPCFIVSKNRGEITIKQVKEEK